MRTIPLFAAATLALCLTAPAARAQEVSQAQIDALVAAAAEVGCVVTAQNGVAVQQAAGLTDAQVTAVIAAMFTAGQVELTEDGSARFTSGPCA